MKILYDGIYIGSIIENNIIFRNNCYKNIKKLVEHHEKKYDKSLISFSYLDEIIPYKTIYNDIENEQKLVELHGYNKILIYFIHGKIFLIKFYKKENIFEFKQNLFPLIIKNKFTDNMLVKILDVMIDDKNNILFKVIKNKREIYLNPLTYIKTFFSQIFKFFGYDDSISSKWISLFDTDEKINLLN